MSWPQGSGRGIVRQVENILASRLNFVYSSANNVFAVDVEIKNLDPNQQVPVSVYFSANLPGKLDYTIDGTTFIHLNDNNTLKADTAYAFAVFLGNGDALNLKFSISSTINFARIGQQI